MIFLNISEKHDIKGDECEIKQHKKPLMAARLNAVTHRATRVGDLRGKVILVARAHTHKDIHGDPGGWLVANDCDKASMTQLGEFSTGRRGTQG